MPWHPALVHFPIACATLAALFQLLALATGRQRYTVSALILLAVGAVMSIVAAVTGTAQEEVVQHIPAIADTLERHENLGTLSALLTTALALGGFYLHMKGRLNQPVFLVSIVALAILLTVTGYWGGLLVYQFGAGGG